MSFKHMPRESWQWFYREMRIAQRELRKGNKAPLDRLYNQGNFKEWRLAVNEVCNIYAKAPVRRAETYVAETSQYIFFSLSKAL